MYNKFPKRSAIYRINDNIDRLHLRVYFRHINSLLNLPKFELYQNAAGDFRSRSSIGNEKNDEQEVQIINLRWQQKILSAHEMEQYKDVTNCLTETQKRYHTWLQAGGGAQLPAEATEDHEESNKTAKRSAKRRTRRKEQQKAATQPQEQIFTYINDDHHQPAEEQSYANQATSYEPQLPSPTVMYVYATLQTADTLLLTLRWHGDDKLLHIYPDFTSFHDNPYYIQIDADYCHLYAYGLENTSPSQALNTHENNLTFLPPIIPYWQSEEQHAAEFSMPPKRFHRLMLLLEIREAREFEYELLHVRYYVRLPKGTVLEEGLLQASTQASAAHRGTHHFGHCWQLTFLCEDCAEYAGLCHIFFEVISIDGWQRERVEGYAHCAYSLQATVTDRQHLRCLRPVDGFLDSLNRFFIGGRQRFDYARFFLGDDEESQPEVNQAFHNRYGCRMKNTGELVVSCQPVTQRNCELLQPCLRKSSGMTLDNIMLAYREARKRLEAIVLQ